MAGFYVVLPRISMAGGTYLATTKALAGTRLNPNNMDISRSSAKILSGQPHKETLFRHPFLGIPWVIMAFHRNKAAPRHAFAIPVCVAGNVDVIWFSKVKTWFPEIFCMQNAAKDKGRQKVFNKRNRSSSQLVSSQERRAADVPRTNCSSNARQSVIVFLNPVYTGFTMFVLPQNNASTVLFNGDDLHEGTVCQGHEVATQWSASRNEERPWARQ